MPSFEKVLERLGQHWEERIPEELARWALQRSKTHVDLINLLRPYLMRKLLYFYEPETLKEAWAPIIREIVQELEDEELNRS